MMAAREVAAPEEACEKRDKPAPAYSPLEQITALMDAQPRPPPPPPAPSARGADHYSPPPAEAACTHEGTVVADQADGQLVCFACGLVLGPLFGDQRQQQLPPRPDQPRLTHREQRQPDLGGGCEW